MQLYRDDQREWRSVDGWSLLQAGSKDVSGRPAMFCFLVFVVVHIHSHRMVGLHMGIVPGPLLSANRLSVSLRNHRPISLMSF